MKWLNQYKSNLVEHEKQIKDCKENLTFQSSNYVYGFGDGRKITSIKNGNVGLEYTNIQSEVLHSNILLLFSMSSGKKAEIKINFQSCTINTFGKYIPLVTTSSGHYSCHLFDTRSTSNQQSGSQLLPSP